VDVEAPGARASQRSGGALAGLRILEMAGLGPAPFAGMMLADHGAEVIRIERPGPPTTWPIADPRADILARSRRILRLDLKRPEGVAVVRRLAKASDALIEGFRPGVMERLGLGPDDLRAEAPALVYARMTGWGQDGPLAATAGHDIDYIALAGALHGIGPAEKPVPPLNLLGDFGGGGLLLAFGVLAAILSAKRTGRGQVIDCAMTDGAALLQAMTYGFLAAGQWRDARGVNLLDGGAPFYDTYETRDGKHVAVGALEPHFFALLTERTGLSGDPDFCDQAPERWAAQREKLAAAFRTRTRDEWCARFEGSDACVAPVLSLREAPAHPHNAARGTYRERNGHVEPAPAPRFSATPAAAPADPDRACARAILEEAGYAGEEAERLLADGTVG
jgi:alpha-methylacyl-CoA racemase